jgi:RHS repeat-associated protein
MKTNQNFDPFYTSFGSVMEGRSFVGDTSDWYRFGYGGQEKDDEISGKGNLYSAEFWEYDARVGRRWNVDPVIKSKMSNYSCFSNNPIIYIDPKGNTDYYNRRGRYIGTDGVKNGETRVALENSSARTIKRATRQKMSISMNANIYRDINPVFSSQKEMDAADRAYANSEKPPNYENGYVVAKNNEDDIEIFDAESYSQDKVDLWPAREEADKFGTILYDAHVHTNEYYFVGNRIRSSPPSPSEESDEGPGDINIRIKSEKEYPNGYDRPSLILGYSTSATEIDGRISVNQVKTVGYYDNKGLRYQISYNELNKLSKKINKDQTKRNNK